MSVTDKRQDKCCSHPCLHGDELMCEKMKKVIADCGRWQRRRMRRHPASIHRAGTSHPKTQQQWWASQLGISKFFLTLGGRSISLEGASWPGGFVPLDSYQDWIRTEMCKWLCRRDGRLPSPEAQAWIPIEFDWEGRRELRSNLVQSPQDRTARVMHWRFTMCSGCGCEESQCRFRKSLGGGLSPRRIRKKRSEIIGVRQRPGVHRVHIRSQSTW